MGSGCLRGAGGETARRIFCEVPGPALGTERRRRGEGGGKGAGQELSYLPGRPPWLHLVERGGKREKGKKKKKKSKTGERGKGRGQSARTASRSQHVPVVSAGGGERGAAVPRPQRVAPCRGRSRGVQLSVSQRCAPVAPRGHVGGTAGWGRRVGDAESEGRRVVNNGSGIRSAAFGGLRGFSTRLRRSGRWQRQQKGSVLLPLPLRL